MFTLLKISWFLVNILGQWVGGEVELLGEEGKGEGLDWGEMHELGEAGQSCGLLVVDAVEELA